VSSRRIPGSGGRTALRRRRRPLAARAELHLAAYDQGDGRSTSLVPTSFSRGQAIESA